MAESELSIQFESTLRDLKIDAAKDFLEVGLDAALDPSVLRELPLVGLLVGASKGAIAMREILFAKKVLRFLIHFHRDDASRQERESFLAMMESGGQRERLVFHVVAILDRYNSQAKAIVLAELVAAHVLGKIDWTTLQQASIALDALHVQGFRCLGRITDSISSMTHERIGDDEAFLLGAGLSYRNGSAIRITKLGQNLWTYGIKPASSAIANLSSEYL